MTLDEEETSTKTPNPLTQPSTNSSTLKPRDFSGSLISAVLINGDGLVNRFKKTICSAGFWARNATDPDINYVVTAGHCFLNAPGNLNFYNHRSWNSQDWKRKGSNFVGKAEKYFIKPFDAGLIFVEGNYKPSMVIRNTDSDLFTELWIMNDILVPSVGAHLCKTGYVTHVTCGHIKSFNGFFINEFSFGRAFIFDTSESRGGDSGGTAFSYQDLRHVSLIGVHSASGFDISVTTPLRTILDSFDIEPYLLKFSD
ncbi:hypothetical protein F8M41_017603 [Gigaspora margarita]|uniref:Serine protease n=1 Tax=Gigaspora margarita TaxID=4874 RepID=A0A8H4AMS2_GIGMA|nr:hypothetical protein F8M41_017603 [Gigaspora margarita]